MNKAFSYLRVSGKGQVDGDGFDRQRIAIDTYSPAHGYQVVREFCEKGVSGTRETMDRPAWAEMMEALRSNGVRTIIVEKLDRLARDLMVQEAAIADLRKQGFELVSVQEPDLMANDPTRVLVRQVMGAVAQYEKSQLVMKLRGSRMRKKISAGRCEGRKPYGDRDGEMRWLEHMRQLRGKGQSFEGIAEDLNQADVLTRYGKKWIGATVCQILRRDK